MASDELDQTIRNQPIFALEQRLVLKRPGALESSDSSALRDAIEKVRG